VTYNHNSRVLASSGDDSTIVLSHTESSERLAVLEPTTYAASPVNSIAFTSKSDQLGCGSLDGSVRVWDLRKKELNASFTTHTDSVSSVVWNHTDQQIASSSLSGDIIIYSLLTRVSIASLKQRGSAGIKVIQFSPFKKNLLGAGSENGSVYLWDVNAKVATCSFPSFHNSPVTGLAFSAINHMLMCTGGLDQRINFYDTQERKLVKTIETEAPLTCVSFNSDGQTLAGGTLYGTVLVYDLRMHGSPKLVLRGHEGNSVNWLEFAKPKEPKRSQRDGSKEPKEPQVKEENLTTTNKFRTIEEIKLEAKLRVEQRRKEKMREERQGEESRPPPAPVKTQESNSGKNSAVNRDLSPMQGPSETVNLGVVNGFSSRSEPVSGISLPGKLEELKVELKSAPEREVERGEEGSVQSPGNVIQMIEERLSLQDEAIFDLREDVRNLHVEMIRQFVLQLVWNM
jgi:hypothetical protein